MPPRWTVSTTGYAATCPDGRPGHQRGQLAAEVDELLGEHLHAALGRRGERLRAVLGRADHPDALAVVTAPGGLEHAGKPKAAASSAERDQRPARARDAHPGQPPPHHRLVLGVHQRLGTGPDREAGVLERVQVLGGHVLVVEGDHRAALRSPRAGCRGRGSRRRAWSGMTWAAETPSASASSRSGIPIAAAGSASMRASCPPPITATVGARSLRGCTVRSLGAGALSRGGGCAAR